MSNQIQYDYQAVQRIPAAMAPWDMRIDIPVASQFGEYVLIGIEQAGIELHHEVEVVDESGLPLRGVWVIFGFPGGGPSIGLSPSRSYWQNAPAVLRGNAQKTSTSGYVRHTFQSGGEDIWVWDLNSNNELTLPSPIVRNCTWQRNPVGVFEHTGVKLTFQRRQANVIPLSQRLSALEAGSTGGGGDSASVAALQQRIEALEQLIG